MKKEKSKLNHRQVIYELKENPLRKFRAAFVLMSIIPFLVFFYLILVRFFSFDVFIGSVGLILTLTIAISLCGFILGYSIISRILRRLMLYAAKVRESDQLKSALVANVSHEVRSPLAIIKLSLANMMDGVSGRISKAQKSVVGRCQETIDRLIRLVNQLLDLSKIEAGKFLMKRSLIDVTLLVHSELINFTPVLKNKDLRLEKQLPNQAIRIWADRDKVVQVFNNIFDNAVKYTPKKGRISVSLSDINGNARIEVEDTGRGISEEKLDKIFDKFERITQDKELGTGLGLPIARDIIEMHHGRIWVESEVGKGSKFVITLPIDLRGKR